MEELRKATTEAEFKAMYEGSFDDALPKIMIVAGQYSQARDFAHVMRIPKNDWKFIEHENNFMGYQNFVIVTLGGMHRKDRIREIMDMATYMVRMRHAKLVHVEDWR